MTCEQSATLLPVCSHVVVLSSCELLCGGRQVAQLEERLAELDEEREELAKYRQVDKERRSLEYTIYDKDLHETRLNLEKVLPSQSLRGRLR